MITEFAPYAESQLDGELKHPRDGATRPIGRARERVFLHEELTRALAGQGRLVLVSGEAGIGKTTLATETLETAHGLHAHVLRAHCYDLMSSPPYGLWLDLGQRYQQQPGYPSFPGALASGHLSDIQSQPVLFSDVLQFLKEITSAGPAVILFEDLHWSDSASLELLRFVAAHIANLPILLLVTYRLDELTRQHPLYQQLPGLVRAGTGLRLDLKRLDVVDTRALVRTRHSFSIEDEVRLIDYLERHAEGNPFFALELMRALEEDALISVSQGSSIFARPDRVIVPPLLAQVLEARVGRIGESARAVLAMASVIGADLSISLWRAIAGVSEEELFLIIERATSASILEADPGGTRVRFSHALARDALYETILPARRRGLHRAVAEVLMAQAYPDPDAVAHHLLLSGDERAPVWLVRAGERAQRTYTWMIAADRFVSAARALEDRPGSAKERGWLLYRAARLVRLADPEHGLLLADEAQRLAEEAGDAMLAGDARYSGGLLLIYSGQLEKGYQEVVAGIEMLESLSHEELLVDPELAITLADSLPKLEGEAESDYESILLLRLASGLSHRRGSLPWWLASLGQNATSINTGVEFVNATSALDNPGGVVQSALGHAHHGMGYAFAASGDPESARLAFEQAHALYGDLDHFGVIALAHLAELRSVAIPYRTDDQAYLAKLCRDLEQAVDRAGGAMPPGFSSKAPLLSLMMIHGRWNEATDVIRELTSSGNTFFDREVTEVAACLAMYRGDNAGAWSLINRHFPEGPEQAPGSRIFLHGLLFQRLAVELCIAGGDLSTARLWLEANNRWLAWSDGVLGIAENKLAWASYWRAVNDFGAARENVHAALSAAGSPRQPLVLLRAHRLRGELDSESNRLESADEQLQFALVHARNCDANYELACTQAAIAKLRMKSGDHASAADLLEQAMATARELNAATLVTKIAQLTADLHLPTKQITPFGLTPREVEILNLIALGLSDAAAAERLFISPRTVGQHLRSVYGKLGVSSRSAATRVAIEHNIASIASPSA